MVEAKEKLRELFQRPAGQIDLAEAALTLARIQYPQLQPEPYLMRLDRYATLLDPELGNRRDPVVITAKINEHLFVREAFYGNVKDYYDPKNSFLNDVLERRTGIPITLCVIYLEIARRLGLPFFGVGLPGHFVIKYDDGARTLFVDPFRAGTLLDRDGCRQLVTSVRGVSVDLTEQDFAAVDERYIILRMLNNLRGIFLTTQQYRKALGAVDLALVLLPDSADEIKQRGLLRFQLCQYGPARTDFERYLQLRPEAEDIDQIKNNIEQLVRLQVMMN